MNRIKNHIGKIFTLTSVFMLIALAIPTSDVYAGASILKPATSWTSYKNLRYSNATKSDRNLLDVYVPNNGSSQNPLIIWVHGGAWAAGSKNADCVPYVTQMMKKGYVVACINYRLTNEAPWPAQIIDVKTAIRALRANASAFKIYPSKIGIWGASAGGHLTVIAGLTANKPEWDKGEWLTTSSSVQAVGDDFGPTDLTTWVKSPCCTAWEPYATKLLGAPILSNPDKAASASPMTYVRAGAPPISIWHGDKDPAVPLVQSQNLYNALRAAGNTTSTLTVQPGMGHGDNISLYTTRANSMATFFDTYLRP